MIFKYKDNSCYENTELKMCDFKDICKSINNKKFDDLFELFNLHTNKLYLDLEKLIVEVIKEDDIIEIYFKIINREFLETTFTIYDNRVVISHLDNKRNVTCEIIEGDEMSEYKAKYLIQELNLLTISVIQFDSKNNTIWDKNEIKYYK